MSGPGFSNPPAPPAVVAFVPTAASEQLPSACFPGSTHPANSPITNSDTEIIPTNTSDGESSEPTPQAADTEIIGDDSVQNDSRIKVSHHPADLVIALGALGLDLAQRPIDQDAAIAQIENALAQGGNPNAVVRLTPRAAGLTVPIIEAAGAERLKVLIYLHEHSADLDAHSGNLGWNALAEAADKLRVGSALLLRAWGLDPDRATAGGWSPRLLVEGTRVVTERYESDPQKKAQKLKACQDILAIFDSPIEKVQELAKKLIEKVKAGQDRNASAA
ncbi:MAG: hypothetical protein QY326_00750 [Bdellovibrionota bacterium]|nr:MAG: hypothetical protein QY326_00750 [Bdellovibrionota bacterium]